MADAVGFIVGLGVVDSGLEFTGVVGKGVTTGGDFSSAVHPHWTL